MPWSGFIDGATRTFCLAGIGSVFGRARSGSEKTRCCRTSCHGERSCWRFGARRFPCFPQRSCCEPKVSVACWITKTILTLGVNTVGVSAYFNVGHRNFHTWIKLQAGHVEQYIFCNEVGPLVDCDNCRSQIQIIFSWPAVQVQLTVIAIDYSF